MEIGVDHRVVSVLLAVPGILGLFSVESRFPFGRMEDLLHIVHFKQRLTVQEHFTDMVKPALIDEPVSKEQFPVRIPFAKEGVGHPGAPHRSFDMLPVLDNLRALDDYALTRRRSIGNPALIIRSAIARLHPLPVFPGADDDSVSRFGHNRCFRYCEKRIYIVAGVGVVSSLCDVKLSIHIFHLG